jgi:hypothetical protein
VKIYDNRAAKDGGGIFIDNGNTADLESPPFAWGVLANSYLHNNRAGRDGGLLHTKNVVSFARPGFSNSFPTPPDGSNQIEGNVAENNGDSYCFVPSPVDSASEFCPGKGRSSNGDWEGAVFILAGVFLALGFAGGTGLFLYKRKTWRKERRQLQDQILTLEKGAATHVNDETESSSAPPAGFRDYIFNLKFTDIFGNFTGSAPDDYIEHLDHFGDRPIVAVGAVKEDDFRIDISQIEKGGKIGGGGFATVHKGKYQGRLCAIKIVRFQVRAGFCDETAASCAMPCRVLLCRFGTTIYCMRCHAVCTMVCRGAVLFLSRRVECVPTHSCPLCVKIMPTLSRMHAAFQMDDSLFIDCSDHERAVYDVLQSHIAREVGVSSQTCSAGWVFLTRISLLAGLFFLIFSYELDFPH